MKKIVKIIGIVLLVILFFVQFIRPEKNESGYEAFAYFENETKPSVEIKTILKNNCYDCHSNHTVYPWYAEIAPVSFWLKGHIDEGKEHFNVSDWQSYSVKKKDHKLEEFIEEVEEEHMPLPSYTWTHGIMDTKEKEVLIQWVKELRKMYFVDK